TPTVLYGGAGSSSGAILQNPAAAPGGSRQAGGGTGGQTQQPGEQEGPPVDTSNSPIPLAELITTYSKELNVDTDGNKRVNVSSANAQALQDAGFPQQVAQRIVQERQQTPLTSVADLLNI